MRVLRSYQICTEPNDPAEKLNNTVVMQVPQRCMRYVHGRHNTLITDFMDKEIVIGIDALFESMNKCAKGVKWKGTVAYYRHYWLDEIPRLSEQLKNGKYKERRAKFFTITEPKRREIMSIHFRDRVYQRSLNDVAIYPQVTRSFVADNFACQKGKGTEPARDRLKDFLQRYYRKHGTDGYVLKIDIKGYYPNMDHGFAEDLFRWYVDDETYEMAKAVLAHLPGEVGYNPGSQIVQIVGITALDEIDHYIKEHLRIKYYVRYMDDFILIHHDKDYLEHCLIEIKKRLEKQEMKISDKKTFIQPIDHPIKHLGFYYRLTETGKVVILADPKKIKHERRKVKRMVALVDKGELTKHDVDVHWKCWKASVRYGNSHNLIYELNRWYESLWQERSNNVYQEKKNGYRS